MGVLRALSLGPDFFNKLDESNVQSSNDLGDGGEIKDKWAVTSLHYTAALKIKLDFDRGD